MKMILSLLAMSIYIIISCDHYIENTGVKEFQLWPEIKPFESDYLKVSKIHNLYYELCGNPDGKPVFLVHGGPGGDISSFAPRCFNPTKFLMISFNQRGCGKSEPFGELRENTTKDLINDMEKIRTHLGLDKILIFGGSWGTTLSIAYAEEYPQNVNGMVLYGIYLGTKSEDEHIFWGARKFFPDAHDKMLHALPENQRDKGLWFVLRSVLEEDTLIGSKYSRIYDEYCYKITRLEISDEIIEKSYSDYDISLYNPSGDLVADIDDSSWWGRSEATTIENLEPGDWQVAAYCKSGWRSVSYILEGMSNY